MKCMITQLNQFNVNHKNKNQWILWIKSNQLEKKQYKTAYRTLSISENNQVVYAIIDEIVNDLSEIYWQYN